MFQQVSTEPRRMRYICVKVDWQKSLFQKEIGELKMSDYKNDLTSKSSRLPCRSPAAMLHSLLHLCNHKQFLTGLHKNPYLEVMPTQRDHLRQILLHEDVFLMCGKQDQKKEMVILLFRQNTSRPSTLTKIHKELKIGSGDKTANMKCWYLGGGEPSTANRLGLATTSAAQHSTAHQRQKTQRTQNSLHQSSTTNRVTKSEMNCEMKTKLNSKSSLHQYMVWMICKIDTICVRF